MLAVLRHWIWSGWLAAIGTALLAGGIDAADYFAAPHGKPAAPGTLDEPWDLATALAHPKPVAPGDTIRLRGGTYRGEFTSTLRGKLGAAIVVRPHGQEHVRIDVRTEGDRAAQFTVLGAHVEFRDLEFFCSDPRRRTEQTGPWPTDILRGSITCKADHASFLNLVVHDLSNGFGFWSEGEGGVIAGCLIYYNGWNAPDRGHGHGIYTQNARGTKRIADNIIFHQFGNGVQAYGSEKAKLEGYEFQGNIFFDNGALQGLDRRTPNLLVGGNQKAARIDVRENYGYHADLRQTCAQFGYGATCADIRLCDNLWGGFVRVMPWERMIVTGSTIVGRSSLVELHAAAPPTAESHRFASNAYFTQEQRYPPLIAVIDKKTLASGWSAWQGILGFDRDGSFEVGRPKGVQVFVRSNPYERGRGHIAVFNWDLAPEVSVDLGGVLKHGDAFRIVSAKDFYGPPLVAGVYDGNPVRLPMKPVKGAPPVGLPDAALPVSEPEFGAFVVLPNPARDSNVDAR